MYSSYTKKISKRVSLEDWIVNVFFFFLSSHTPMMDSFNLNIIRA